MRSIPEFLIIALLVTLTPGPATANVLRGCGAAVLIVLGARLALESR